MRNAPPSELSHLPNFIIESKSSRQGLGRVSYLPAFYFSPRGTIHRLRFPSRPAAGLPHVLAPSTGSLLRSSPPSIRLLSTNRRYGPQARCRMHRGGMLSLGDDAAGRGHEVTVVGTVRDLRFRGILRRIMLWLALPRNGIPDIVFRSFGWLRFRNGIPRILLRSLLFTGLYRRSSTSSLRRLSGRRMLLGESLDLFLRRCPGGIRMNVRIPIDAVGIAAAGSKLQSSLFGSERCLVQ